MIKKMVNTKVIHKKLKIKSTEFCQLSNIKNDLYRKHFKLTDSLLKKKKKKT